MGNRIWRVFRVIQALGLVILVSPEMQVNIWDKPKKAPNPNHKSQLCISGETNIFDHNFYSTNCREQTWFIYMKRLWNTLWNTLCVLINFQWNSFNQNNKLLFHTLLGVILLCFFFVAFRPGMQNRHAYLCTIVIIPSRAAHASFALKILYISMIRSGVTSTSILDFMYIWLHGSVRAIQ